MPTGVKGCSWGRRDTYMEGGMFVGMQGCSQGCSQGERDAPGNACGTLSQLAWSKDNEPGLAKLLSGVNGFVGSNRAGYGTMLWEKPQH